MNQTLPQISIKLITDVLVGSPGRLQSQYMGRGDR